MGDLSGTLYFNAPGFRSDSVDIAPAIDSLKTKRKPLIEKEVIHNSLHARSLYNGVIFVGSRVG
jgi:hypothetical protein